MSQHPRRVCLAVIFLAVLGPLLAFSGRTRTEPSSRESQRTSLSAPSSIADRTAGWEKLSGWFPVYKDEKAGKLWLEIDKLETEFLYYPSLPAGLGSNDIGLDRAQLGRGKAVFFRRIGPRVLMIEPNQSFRAETADADVRRNVADSFAQSVIWGFPIEAEEGGRLLVEATAFLLRDAMNIADTIGRRGQGQFRVDETRSAVDLSAARNFPFNTEIDALLTLTGINPGMLLRTVAPDASALTFRVHHSFAKLPDPGYKLRASDPRSNFYGQAATDFAVPVGEPMDKSYVSRFRLEKKDPSAVRSEAVKPIVYYVDRGIPEPIRTAVLEGASWWNQAFEAAGYINAFQVKLLPEGADPMDIRYNMINWVNRSTRGWSYGGGLSDPRTGELIKGHVSLGSLRIRQDYLIAESLIGAYEEGGDNAEEIRKMAMARIRQLSAHEVGHTLGMGHNFAASADGRASVMDYPHPFVDIKADGTLDLSKAYETGIGEFDKVAVEFAYRDYPAGVEADEASKAVLEKAFAAGRVFLSDSDSGPSGAHPLTAAWDNGRNLVDELERVMRVRDIALKTFSEKRVRPGASLALLEEPLVTAYLFHRYQTEAAAASIGGLMYFHRLRGDAQKPSEIVSPVEQRRALDLVLKTLSPDFLALDERIVALIPPRISDYPETRELFGGRTGEPFDPFTPVEEAAGMTAGLILNPARASRLVEYHSRMAANPGLDEVIDKLLSATWNFPPASSLSSYKAEVKRVIDKAALSHLLALAASDEAAAQARAIALLKIDDLKKDLMARLGKASGVEEKAHFKFGIFQIEQFEKNPDAFKRPTLPAVPPGAPIGY